MAGRCLLKCLSYFPDEVRHDRSPLLRRCLVKSEVRRTSHEVKLEAVDVVVAEFPDRLEPVVAHLGVDEVDRVFTAFRIL
jgi:hypothetical protein